MNKKLVYIISFLICCINFSNVFADHLDDLMGDYDRYRRNRIEDERYEDMDRRVKHMERQRINF